MSIREAFRKHRNSLAGRIVIFGSVLNLLLAGFLAWQAWEFIPGPAAEDFAVAAALCVAAPLALLGTWMSHHRRFQSLPNGLLAALLLFIATAPSVFAYLRVSP